MAVSTSRMAALILTLLFTHASRADDDEDRKKLLTELKRVGEVYAGEKFRDIEKKYVDVLKKRDLKAWQDAVREAGDEKRRKSFVGEYLAFGGDYQLLPLDEFGPDPLLTKKHRLRILLFRPDKPNGDAEPLSDKLKATTYLIIRSPVPMGEGNAYGVFISQALRGYTAQQLRQIVNAYQDEL